VTRRAKKDPPSSGGWHAFLTSNAASDVSDPVMAQWLSSACDKALPGWPCDPEMEKLRTQYARETDPAKLKVIAEAVQVRVTEWTPLIPLGMWYPVAPARKNVAGILDPGVPVFWNVKKN
jgi:peptide/nickel transport system substrate-binding protein